MTGPRRGAWGPRACAHLALRLAGARVVHLRPGDELNPAGLDAVVITGGHDVQPTLYKAVEEVRGRYDPERDAFEAAVIDAFLARGGPLLAICRGAQLLNVQLGGDLVQDLTPRRRLTSNRRSLLPLKRLLVEPDTLLARCLGPAPVAVNSLHRQAVERLGEGLRVSALDLDGIVQAVEHTEHDFVLGVQWHPELLVPLSRQRRLFHELVGAARRRRDPAPGEQAP